MSQEQIDIVVTVMGIFFACVIVGVVWIYMDHFGGFTRDNLRQTQACILRKLRKMGGR